MHGFSRRSNGASCPMSAAALQIREGRSSITRRDLDEISGVFAWQLGAGLRIGISERLSADLGVRYFEAGNVEQQLILAGFAFVLAP